LPNAAVSRSHLSRAFAESTGATLADHAANLRVARAKELMTESALTMSDIAARLGFASPSAFVAAFRRATGLSPLQYSRTIRGGYCYFPIRPEHDRRRFAAAFAGAFLITRQ